MKQFIAVYFDQNSHSYSLVLRQLNWEQDVGNTSHTAGPSSPSCCRMS
jgi:hypothetical protein